MENDILRVRKVVQLFKRNVMHSMKDSLDSWRYIDYRFVICHHYCELCFAKVSWVRHRDIHILTAGAYTYTSDQRFQALHRQNTGHSNEWSEWTLCIKWAQERDQGIYECQISTIPIKSYQFRLNVVGKFHASVQSNLTRRCPRFHRSLGISKTLRCTLQPQSA